MKKLFDLLSSEDFSSMVKDFKIDNTESYRPCFDLSDDILTRYQKLRSVIPSMEAIEAQRHSKLGELLTREFQKALDFVNSIDVSKEPNGKKDYIIRKNTINYTKETLIPGMIKAIKNAVNINVKRVHTSLEPSCWFAVEPIINAANDEDWLIWDKAYGGRYFGEQELDTTVDELIGLSNTVDLKTGKFKTTKWGKKKNREIACELYFDPHIALLLRTYLPSHNYEEFTARELAAIYLHEIGHLTSFVERASDIYYYDHTVRRSIEVFKNADLKELCEAFNKRKNDIIKAIKEMSQNHPNKKAASLAMVLLGLFFKIVEQVLYYAEYDPEDDDDKVTPYIWAFLRSILLFCGHFWWCFMGLGTLLLNYGIFYVVSYLYSQFVNSILVGYRDDGYKGSDTIYTEFDFTASERDADEYAVRSGYGADQQEGLRKLRLCIEYIFNSPGAMRIPYAVRDSRFLFYVNEILYVLKRLFYSPWPFPVEVHGRDIDRAERIATQTLKVLKSVEDKHMRDTYLKQYEDILESIRKAKADKSVKIEAINIFANRLLDGGVLSTLFGSANLPEDYSVFKEQLDRMMNNKLYYVSHKLAQIAEMK